jgi:hypothetical protein
MSCERGKIGEAVAILGLHKRKVQSMSQRGKLPGAAKIEREWTYDLVKLRRYVEERERACQSGERRRPDATGAALHYGVGLGSMAKISDGPLTQMIRQSRKRAARRAKAAS